MRKMTNATSRLREVQAELQDIADDLDDGELCEELEYAGALVERVESRLEHPQD